MPTTAPGRRGDATRSGLGQVDAAEDLVAVVAAAVAVDVPRSVVHVLDHGRAADRRVAVYVVLLRRVALQYFFDVVREGPDLRAFLAWIAAMAYWRRSHDKGRGERTPQPGIFRWRIMPSALSWPNLSDRSTPTVSAATWCVCESSS